MEAVAASTELKINEDKNHIFMKMKTKNSQTVTVTNGSIDEIGEYLGNVTSTTGGTNQNVDAVLGKARSTFRAMEKLWKSKIIGALHLGSAVGFPSPAPSSIILPQYSQRVSGYDADPS